MGPPDAPVVPPALIADIGGGAYPALISILLALRQREIAGRGMQLDIAMTENLFPFMYWALGNGLAAGQWPRNGADLVTGGSPRYRLYATGDGGMIAAAPLEQRFWDRFCAEIGLDEALRNDEIDPVRTAERVAEIIAGRPTEDWRGRFAAADCCCCVVATVEEALANGHFRERGVFSGRLVNEEDAELPALPLPLAPALRAEAGEARHAPALGEHQAEN
jgi:crotonobetainyl-CoA:carnitine CoA-transferase CaiB-like acyl-CoA transferase